MSGAEVLTVLGATSSVITICETCATIVRFIQKCQPSETTATLKPQVDLLAQIITQLKPLCLDSSAHGLSAVLSGCEKELQKLLSLIEDYQQASSTTLLGRARKSFKVPIWEEKIRQNWTCIQQYQSTISLYLDFYNTTRLLNAPRTDHPLYLVPLQPSIQFVGRQDIFDKISSSINHCTRYPCMLSLTGLGGMGKTQIALQLCHRGKTTYSVIVWIHAQNETSFTQGVLNFANKLSGEQRTFNDREDSLSYIHEVAKNRTRPWLFVLDDWDFADWKPNLFHFLADGRQRDMIATTTRNTTPSWGIQIQIPPLPEKDAEQLILHQSLFSSSVDEVDAARDLARKLGYLPLSLSMVSAAMRSKGSTPRQFVELLKSSESIGQKNRSKTIDSVFSLTVGEIRREDSRLVDFLLQMSFIAVPAEIMFRDHFLVAQSRGEPLPTFHQLFVHEKQWSSELFLHAVMRLATYGLVKEELIGESGLMVLSLHRLVRAFLQRELLPAGTNLGLQLMLQATAIIAAPLIAHDWEELSFYHRQVFRDNILECVQQRNSIINGPDHIRGYSGILEGYQTAFAAFLAMYSNMEKQARGLLLESLSLQSTWLGESAPLTCRTMIWLVLLYLESMSLDEAEVMINRLNTAEFQAPKHQGRKHQKVPLVDVQFLKGHLEMRKRNIDHAVSIFKHCTDLYANITGISYVGTASALISGVEAMLLQGNVEDATQTLYDAERIQKEIGSPRALAIRVKWNLARYSLRMGDHVRAISRYKDLCEEHENNHDQVGSPSHRWESLHCELADVYLDLGDIQKAKSEYDVGRASEIRRSRFLKIDSKDISQWLIHDSLVRTRSIPFVRDDEELAR